ncbi:MAG TPA: C13 family peptidase [Geomonas sp.]
MSLLLRVDPDQLCATPVALALLALTDAILNLGVSFLFVGRGGSFAYSAVPVFFFHLPLLLLCGFLAGRVLSRPSLVTTVPVALVALSIPIELCHALLEWLAQLRQMGWLDSYLDVTHYYRFFWWWTAATLLFALRLAPAPVSRRIATLLLFTLLLAPLWFYPRGDLWVSASEGSESGELHLTEQVLAAQARLLDRQLAGLLPGRRGEPNLYFVGFAGDATQDVFLKELLAAEKLFTGRFGTAGRSVILANNPQTALTLPFASATNLERALTRLGQVMNREDDVLLLFLTSHGSREHELAVNNRPLELDGLTPEMLRRMLKKSGIAWKVLVVSACYAGGFIDPLKDDRSLIITAADASHESFGCGYGEEFTWFGEAFLGGALRDTFSFTAAFEKARETIRQWEEKRGETPSSPQIWAGREIGKKLSVLEKRLARGAREP